MLILNELRDVLGDELMLPDFGDKSGFTDFVNEGMAIWAQHPWAYLNGRQFELPIVEGQSEVELDERVITVDSVWPKEAYHLTLDVIAPDEFVQRERFPGNRGRAGYCTVRDLPSKLKELKGELTPFLILPTGNRTLSSPLIALCNLAPRRLDESRGELDVPHRLEAAFKAFLRAYARGRFDIDAGGVEKELDTFFGSRIFIGAVRMDSGMTNAVVTPTLGVAGQMMAGRGFDEDGDGWRYGRAPQR